MARYDRYDFGYARGHVGSYNRYTGGWRRGSGARSNPRFTGDRGMQAGYGRPRGYDVEGGFGVMGHTVRSYPGRPPAQGYGSEFGRSTSGYGRYFRRGPIPYE